MQTLARPRNRPRVADVHDQAHGGQHPGTMVAATGVPVRGIPDATAPSPAARCRAPSRRSSGRPRSGSPTCRRRPRGRRRAAAACPASCRAGWSARRADPAVAELPSVSYGAAISAAMIRNAPPMPEATTARMIVRGVGRARLVRLLGQLARAVETDHHVRRHQRRDEQRYDVPGRCRRGPSCAVRRTDRARRLVNSMTISTTPTSSQVTPTLVDDRHDPHAGRVQHRGRRPAGGSPVRRHSRAVLGRQRGSVPTSWKPDQTAGSTTCRAIAAAAKVMICAITIVQPANHPTTAPPRRRDHW